MNPQTNCHIFRLPQELRDEIYEYVFASNAHRQHITLCGADPWIISRDANWDDSLAFYKDLNCRELGNDGTEVRAPQVDLALTCRRIHHESIKRHQKAYAAFWTNNIFEVSRDLAVTEWFQDAWTMSLEWRFRNTVLTAKHIEHMTRISFEIGELWPSFASRDIERIELFSKPGSGKWNRRFERKLFAWRDFMEYKESGDYRGCLNDKFLHFRSILRMLGKWTDRMHETWPSFCDLNECDPDGRRFFAWRPLQPREIAWKDI